MVSLCYFFYYMYILLFQTNQIPITISWVIVMDIFFLCTPTNQECNFYVSGTLKDGPLEVKLLSVGDAAKYAGSTCALETPGRSYLLAGSPALLILEPLWAPSGALCAAGPAQRALQSRVVAGGRCFTSLVPTYRTSGRDDCAPRCP